MGPFGKIWMPSVEKLKIPAAERIEIDRRLLKIENLKREL